MKIDVIKALKDERFREGLSLEHQAALPSPAGTVELRDESLQFVVGGLQPTTGTGGYPPCYCAVTVSAISGGGTCYCDCTN